MRIINTKINNFKFFFAILFFGICILSASFGCAKKDELGLAQECEARSQVYYQHAVERYKQLIAKGQDLDRLHSDLGRIYYEHGEFDKAQAELKKTNFVQAKKLLAIAYYRNARFTDALEIFNRQEIADDEYLYYHGLVSEKLNLHDQALSVYRKIKSKRYLSLALERINGIEKEAKGVNIKAKNPEIYKIINSAPEDSQYPQAGALMLYCDENVELTLQGTEVSSLHYVIKILNDRGKEDFSEAHIEYDTTFEKIELEFARTIKPDGTVVDVGSRHVRDVSKYLNFPLYSNAHVYIISFPEIERGSIIEYKVKIYNSELINKKDFVLHYTVQSQEPIIFANFTVTLPKERKLNVKVINEKYNDFKANLNPVVKEKEGSLIYGWQFQNIPQIIPETKMPPVSEINPSILLSTFNGWDEIYKWWWELAKDKINADSSIKDKVRELISGKASDEEKIRAIYNFCAQEIRYVAVEYGQAGYEPHYASDIFRNKYGDCKDKAILLVTMLKETGIRGWPVLIATKESYNLNRDFPAVIFNHCIAVVSLKEKLVFLDPTAQTCAFGDLPADDQGRSVLVFKEDKYEIQDTPLYEAEHNLIKQYLVLKVNKDEGVIAQRSILTFGIYDQGQRYWLLYTQPELIQETLKQKIQEVSIGAKLEKYNIENLEDLNRPMVLSYSFKGPEYFTVAGPLRITPQLSSLDTSLVAKDRRNYPLDFGILDTKETYFEIEIPENFTIKYLPDDVNLDSPWLQFIADYSFKKNKIYFEQEIKLKTNFVSEDEYLKFKEFFQDLAKRIKQRIVLEKTK